MPHSPNTAQSAPDRYLTEREVCELFHLSRPTMRRERAKGAPHLKVGDTYRYNAAELVEWFRARALKPTEVA
jgi:predicted DNA-binding transcriptional regulator AlpA